MRGDAVDVVARLKEESDVPSRSHGSLSLNRALTCTSANASAYREGSRRTLKEIGAR